MKSKKTVAALSCAFIAILSHQAQAVVTITVNGTVTNSNSSSLNIGDSVSILFVANAAISTPNGEDSSARQYWEYDTALQTPLWSGVSSPTLGGTFSNSFPGDQMLSQIVRFPVDNDLLSVLAGSDESGFDIGLTSDGLPVSFVDFTFRGSHVPLITNTYFAGQTLDQTFKNGTFTLTGGFSDGEVFGLGGYEFDIDSVTIAGAAVPEPSSLGLALVGVFGAVARRRRK